MRIVDKLNTKNPQNMPIYATKAGTIYAVGASA
jgi:hypothetical protein